jgi:nucleobase:cation symporter-1, NCS1 family
VRAPSWGIEPVPDRLRVLGFVDTTLLWINLGISLLVLVLPAYFDLSLKDALAATLVGGLIGNSMLALAALIGADGRVPTMVLQRAPLGRRGSYIATVLNIAQCLGWAIFELIVIATAAGLLCDQLFGFEATWAWKLLFGGLAAALALLGPIGFVRRFVRKFAIWAVALSVVYLAWWIVDGANLGSLWSNQGDHHGSFWLAVDTVVAVTVSWAPLVADYTRFSRDRRSAFFGVGIGYLLPTLFQFGFGSILVLSRGVDPNHPELILTAIAGGGAAAALALLALTVDETDEAFANVYSSAVSTQNVLSRVPQRALIAGAAVIATAGALAIDMRSYQRFLLLLGAVFVPLLGVLVAHWLYNGAHYSERDIFGSPSFRLGPIFSWAAGFLVYEWLYQPTDLGFWSDLMAKLPQPGYQVGASLPSFALAFVLTGVFQTLSSPRATMTAEPPTSTRSTSSAEPTTRA